MDNVTHTLAGFLVAEAALVWVARRRSAGHAGAPAPETGRLVLLIASAVANNLPDADFVYASITPGKFGYLLHHRGHTHTLVFGLLLGFLCFLVFERWLKSRLERADGSAADAALERRALLFLCLAGPVVHLALDATNNYGVHPFWPAYSGWSFGDAVFIVEPWFWMVSGPALFWNARSLVGRAGALLVLGLGLALAFLVPEPSVPLGITLLMTVAALALLLLGYRASRGRRVAVGVGGWLLVTGVFFASSASARSLAIDSLVRSGTARADVVDVVSTPDPANPACFSVIALLSTAGTYRVYLGRVAPLPSLMTTDKCPWDRLSSTAELEPLPRSAASARVFWHSRYQRPVSELVTLARRCDTAALLRFMRVPFWRYRGDELVFGDLRYDFDAHLGFAEVSLGAKEPRCPPRVPGWLPPRRDLLAPER